MNRIVSKTISALSIAAVLVTPMLALARYPDFKSVEEAAEYAKSQLASGEATGDAAIVFQFTYSDGTQKPAKGTFYLRGGSQGIKPKPNEPGLFFVRVNSKDYGIRLGLKGYHEVYREIKVEKGEVVIVDDLVLEPLTPESASEVSGRVWLEGDGDLEKIAVRVDKSGAFTDATGAFRITGLRSGQLNLSASFPEGYRRYLSRVDLEPRSHKVVNLKGYLKRTASVRWAYQPVPGRQLQSGLQTGEATLGVSMLERIKCAEGFADGNRGDFNVQQRGAELQIVCAMRRVDGAGFQRITDRIYDDVLEAPLNGYQQTPTALAEGDIFVFRTLDGQHYGKFEVLRINVGKEEKVKPSSTRPKG